MTFNLFVCQGASFIHYDERYQLDASIMIYYHKLPLHISDIYVSIFRSFLYTDCLLLHVVFSTVKNNEALAVMHQSMLYVALCGMLDGFVKC